MKTILVVDDEHANAEVLSVILQEEGYRAYSAANGRQGLDKAKEVRPDLIVLDLMMPIMNGAEMARALKADASTRRIKIVMNSGLNEEAVRAHFDGYDGFLRKPYGVNALLGLLNKLLNDF